jgi:hypothetical protein
MILVAVSSFKMVSYSWKMDMVITHKLIFFRALFYLEYNKNSIMPTNFAIAEGCFFVKFYAE